MKNRFIVALVLIPALSVVALSQSAATVAARKYRKENETKLIRNYLELLSIPNVASDRENIRRNAEYLRKELERRGLAPQLLTPGDRDAPPAVFGEYKVPGATRTVVFYAHYDGQPTDPADWTVTTPWSPQLLTEAIEKGGQKATMPSEVPLDPEWRIYGRSASDDKAGVFTILNAFDALKASGIEPSVNLKFFFEGEEEAGSPNLRAVLTKHRELLRADAWIIADGPVHQSGRKLVSFGVRGVTSASVTVYGANRDLHSGHYGNWSPNPGMRLVKLLSSMKDANGRVLIEGWYDDVEPLGVLERKAIADAPKYDDDLRRELGLAESDGNGRELLDLLNEPSLNINGMKTGNVGALARNVISSKAEAVLGLRLVKGNDHWKQLEKLRKHIVSQGFYVIDREPTSDERLKHPLIAKFIPETSGYNAQRTAMDLDVSQAVIEAVRNASGEMPVTLPTMGGSLPLSIITEALEDPALITVPVVNYDNNQHAADENVRIGNLWDGIEIIANVMTIR
ncbi:MAG: M20/M25/M40 family metallo-hydrolase [Acidobacteria bacterium]|nr:MAG: M20/M25/M40 family metallo-hydrolase [Acidobacteriota bacterium]REK03954.1 MAG: M20/M25/M40 family metallo-hydrolase [Acidobacteriota bacterium]REK15116.1 MAG: M20/M25/M40 family metallo-hydrolase [Acidobacteriota bacterium]REK46206.1 MAG: M20/M25/M40 family metallo-hydrolase [Acidobacteriota bacterium]